MYWVTMHALTKIMYTVHHPYQILLIKAIVGSTFSHVAYMAAFSAIMSQRPSHVTCRQCNFCASFET